MHDNGREKPILGPLALALIPLRRRHTPYRTLMGDHTLGIILLVILLLAVIGSLPTWSHSRSWGYMPTGGLGLVLIVVLILVLMGRI